jgi:8-oxo-dGTP pyrophosphatase MutT (NUDIX family)
MQSASDYPSPAGGSCDCGTFFLDLAGRFARHQLRIAPTATRRQSNQEIENIIEQTWIAEIDCARRSGKRLYNGSLYRLGSFACASGELSLELAPVSFKEFLGTNLTHAYLRYIHGPEVLADALGVSACLRARDGFLLMGRRSQRVFYHAGRIHPIGGVVEAGKSSGEITHPFEAVIAELLEETNLSAEAITEISCLGLVRDKHIVQPELIFDVVADADVKAIRRACPPGGEEEHSELLFLRDHPAAVVAFMEQNYGDLTPVGLATLLLHGLRHWGSGWFAATRGHLRSVT